MRTPTLPTPGQNVKTWARTMRQAVRANVVTGGPGIRVSRFGGGTTVQAARRRGRASETAKPWSVVWAAAATLMIINSIPNRIRWHGHGTFSYAGGVVTITGGSASSPQRIYAAMLWASPNTISIEVSNSDVDSDPVASAGGKWRGLVATGYLEGSNAVLVSQEHDGAFDVTLSVEAEIAWTNADGSIAWGTLCTAISERSQAAGLGPWQYVKNYSVVTGYVGATPLYTSVTATNSVDPLIDRTFISSAWQRIMDCRPCFLDSRYTNADGLWDSFFTNRPVAFAKWDVAWGPTTSGADFYGSNGCDCVYGTAFSGNVHPQFSWTVYPGGTFVTNYMASPPTILDSWAELCASNSIGRSRSWDITYSNIFVGFELGIFTGNEFDYNAGAVIPHPVNHLEYRGFPVVAGTSYNHTLWNGWHAAGTGFSGTYQHPLLPVPAASILGNFYGLLDESARPCIRVIGSTNCEEVTVRGLIPAWNTGTDTSIYTENAEVETVGEFLTTTNWMFDAPIASNVPAECVIVCGPTWTNLPLDFFSVTNCIVTDNTNWFGVEIAWTNLLQWGDRPDGYILYREQVRVMAQVLDLMRWTGPVETGWHYGATNEPGPPPYVPSGVTNLYCQWTGYGPRGATADEMKRGFFWTGGPMWQHIAKWKPYRDWTAYYWDSEILDVWLNARAYSALAFTNPVPALSGEVQFYTAGASGPNVSSWDGAFDNFIEALGGPVFDNAGEGGAVRFFVETNGAAQFCVTNIVYPSFWPGGMIPVTGYWTAPWTTYMWGFYRIGYHFDTYGIDPYYVPVHDTYRFLESVLKGVGTATVYGARQLGDPDLEKVDMYGNPTHVVTGDGYAWEATIPGGDVDSFLRFRAVNTDPNATNTFGKYLNLSQYSGTMLIDSISGFAIGNGKAFIKWTFSND